MSEFLWLCKLRCVRLAAAEDSQEWTSSICWPWRHPTSAPRQQTLTGMQPAPAHGLLALDLAMQADVFQVHWKGPHSPGLSDLIDSKNMG